MKSFKYYYDILLSLGYRESKENELGYQFLNGYLTNVDMYSPTGKLVTFDVTGSAEYDEYIEKLTQEHPNEEIDFTWDYSRMVVNFVFFESPICNVSGYIDNDRSGLTLDGIDREESGFDYYPHKLTTANLRKFAYIQEHPIEHEYKIAKAHVRNLSKINKVFIPILDKYDFYQDYSSLLDSTVDSGYEKDNSNPFVTFKHKYAKSARHECIVFETDVFNGKLILNGEYFSGDFEKWLIEDFMKDKKVYTTNNIYDTKIYFRYLFDDSYKPESADEIFYAMQVWRDMKEFGHQLGDYRPINWDLIPKAEMDKAFKELKELCDKKEINGKTN